MSSQQQAAILIVEDERILAIDLQASLRDMGYDAFGIANTAEAALAAAAKRRPDLVLMDIRIKGNQDGIQAAQRLREEFGIPVIYLMAHSDRAILERAKKTEPHGYITKPVSDAALSAVITLALHRVRPTKPEIE